MIEIRPYDDFEAMAVFRQLDPDDFLEAELVRGAAVSHLSLWGDWRQAQHARLASYVFSYAGAPFAVGALAHSGAAGVAEAALLAREHRRFRRPLIRLARQIRSELPEFCARLGIRRIEARCYAGHPRAAQFLEFLGFRHEADLPGFGATGAVVFRQFAWVAASRGPGDGPEVASSPSQPTGD
jgi:hypothetical protein